MKMSFYKRKALRLHALLWGALLTLILFTSPANIWAQANNAIIRVGIEEGSVYVYHTMQVPMGQGFNIYRSEGGEFQKLNDEPVRGAGSVGQFVADVNEYMPLLQEAVDEENEQLVYFKLRASRVAQNLATFYYPDVARALGRLYIDETAPVGSTVTYRIELVDEQGKPTDDTITREVSLDPAEAPKPFGLEADHLRREVTLTWKYPTSTLESDDKIVRFNIYNKQGGELQKLNEQPVIRINNFEEFRHVFTVPRMGTTLNLVVMPVSLTTSEGPASDVLEYTIEDKQPPQVVQGLKARATDEGIVELTWPVSTEADAAGYNIYRGQHIKGEYTQLNDEPIDLLQTLYTDRPSKTRKTYFYRVTAIDSAGNESERSNAAKADVKDLVPPDAPTSITAMAREDGTVEVSWSAPPQEPDFKTYVLLRRQQTRYAGQADAQLNKEDLSDSVFVDRGEADLDLADGAKYRYMVFAVDSARNFSDTVSTEVKIPDVTPPEAPTEITVRNDDGIRAILRWNASRSNDVTQYVLYRGTSAESLNEYRRLSVKDRFVRDDSVEVGKRYHYALSAVDSLGNEGVTTDTLSFLMRDFTPPRAVRNVRTKKEEETITITWEPVPTPDLAGYKVYTARIPTGEFVPVSDELASETSMQVGAGSVSGYIRVRAVDTSGNESKPSEPVAVSAGSR